MSQQAQALRLVKSASQSQAQAATELEVTLQEYLVAFRQKRRSVRTVNNYEWHLRRMATWLTERGAASPGQASRMLLREWGAGLHDQWQPATVRQAISAARSYFKYCCEERLLDDNPAMALSLPKEKQRVQRTMLVDEVKQMLAGCNIETVKGLRDRAMVALLFDSGLRAAELCRLKVADVNLEAREFKVIIKGGNETPGWFGRKTAEYLQAWLRVRLAPKRVRTLFISVGGLTPGRLMTVGGLRRTLQNLGTQVGVKNVTVHAFRRGFAVKLSADGVPDNILKDFGRWEDTKMIKRYTAAQQVRRLFPEYSPMDNLDD